MVNPPPRRVVWRFWVSLLYLGNPSVGSGASRDGVMVLLVKKEKWEQETGSVKLCFRWDVMIE